VLIIAVTVTVATEVLIDGVMTNHELFPRDRRRSFNAYVTGKELSQVMDYIDFSGSLFLEMLTSARPPDSREIRHVRNRADGDPSVLIDIPIPTEQNPAAKKARTSLTSNRSQTKSVTFSMSILAQHPE